MYKVKVIDWSDVAYEKCGEKHVEEVIIDSEKPPAWFSYDGGRVDIQGHPDTIWVMGHQFSIEIESV
jgi:hypothetical protein